ncbi:hypothetical protein BV25DRAFT_1799962 [Artomyces pyxidatus]|uniref:Uncharacterized protein n=1 Tax=Artomyces pyxidatus TaxID=48021 RepID=A0ACB8T7L0_9AGAM|nr:hypothetical protein BV25DRAFT_1799962 [Artomyces pyxidatus]
MNSDIGVPPPDDSELFLERLDAFTDKSLADIKAFADREGVAYDQVRRHVAERHCKYLFDADVPASNASRQERVKGILLATSHALESLQTTAGLHSFLVVVDPADPSDDGFLGGTLLGREFWRSLRGGGAPGTKAFKTKAKAPAALPKETAHTLKAELYAAARTALRSASGVRNADMKWTNHDNLAVYGVRIVGWPAGVPMQNPSTLSTAQNRLLKECFARGSLRFCRLGKGADGPVVSTSTSVADAADLSWAISDDAYSSVSRALLPLGTVADKYSAFSRWGYGLHFTAYPHDCQS